MPEPILRRWALAILILTSLVFGLLLIPGAVGILFSPMAFDTGITTIAVLFVGCWLAYPLLVLIAIPGSWIAYRKQAFRTAILVSLLPAVDVLAIASFFLLN